MLLPIGAQTTRAAKIVVAPKAHNYLRICAVSHTDPLDALVRLGTAVQRSSITY